MTKVERLRWIEETYGSEFVLPYRVCWTWRDILAALDWLWREVGDPTPGIRTDRRGVDGRQIHSLPFLWPVRDNKEALDFWRQHFEALVYIVSSGAQPVRAHGVATAVDGGMVVEVNDREPWATQRTMYRRSENVRLVGVSDEQSYLWLGPRLVRAVRPHEGSWLRLDTLYDLLPFSPEGEITFSVKPEGRLIVW